MAITHTHPRLSISGLGWGFSATLVVLFILCMLSALFLPTRAAHGWVTLLSDAPFDIQPRLDRRAGLERRRRMAECAGVGHGLQLDRRAPCGGIDPPLTGRRRLARRLAPSADHSHGVAQCATLLAR